MRKQISETVGAMVKRMSLWAMLALLLLATALWSCGPWIERILLPNPEAPAQSA